MADTYVAVQLHNLTIASIEFFGIVDTVYRDQEAVALDKGLYIDVDLNRMLEFRTEQDEIIRLFSYQRTEGVTVIRFHSQGKYNQQHLPTKNQFGENILALKYRFD